MCLNVRYSKEIEKQMIARLPDGLITVYRVVKRKSTGAYHSIFYTTSFRKGMNLADTSRGAGSGIGRYSAGYHSFRAKTGASSYRERPELCVKFQIRKEWITAIGTQMGSGWKRSGVCYVTDRVIAPSCRDKSAIV